MTEENIKLKKPYTKGKIFPVPFVLGEINEKISISTSIVKKPFNEKIINQAFRLHRQGKISQAAKYYQYCINQGLSDSRVFTNYGDILKSFGNLEGAEIFTRKAIKLQPGLAMAHMNLGSILKENDKLPILLSPPFNQLHGHNGDPEIN